MITIYIFKMNFRCKNTFLRTPIRRRSDAAPTPAGSKTSFYAPNKGRKKPSLSHPGIKVRPASASASRVGAEKCFCFFLIFYVFSLKKLSKNCKFHFSIFFDFSIKKRPKIKKKLKKFCLRPPGSLERSPDN